MTLATALVFIITLIVYSVNYANTNYMSWPAFWFMLISVVLAAGLMVAKLNRFAPAVLFVGIVLGVCFFIYGMYFFISSVAYGIQFSGFPPQFIACVVLFSLSLVLSIVAVFMRQTKK